jgi:predicted ATP-dependent protease
MNQHGQIQPIGGVNEKVSGFYQFVKERDFPEGCGVMIPEVNKVNLMLEEEIIEAVREGKFHIYPINRIEQGLELMTGLPAGELDGGGDFPAGSIYGKCMASLLEFSKEAKPNGGDDKSGREPAKDTEEAASS